MVPRQNQYDYLYIFAAACCQTGDAVALIAPRADTEVMNHFLEQFGKSLPDDVHAAMILDQAAWHTGNDVRIPPNVTLIYLPPRSPELNPIENLWHWITSHHWSNRVHTDYAHMLHAAGHALDQTFDDPGRIKSICNAPYLVRAK